MPVLPMQPGLVERRFHDYVRHGSTTLFAALEIATGQVTAAVKPRHRNTEFLAFLKQIERAYRDVPDEAGKPVELHLVMDNYAAHKDPQPSRPGWPRTRGSSSTSTRPMHRGCTWSRVVLDDRAPSDPPRRVFTSVKDFNAKSRAYVDGCSDRSHPFVWTKTADQILKKANRMKTSSERH